MRFKYSVCFPQLLERLSAEDALCGRVRADGWWRALGNGSQAALVDMDDKSMKTWARVDRCGK